MFEFSCDYTTLLLSAGLFFALFYIMNSKRKRNFPPGPSGLPLVGYVPWASGNLGEKFFKLKEKHGNVISIRIASDDWVVLNDFEVINEAFAKKGHAFSGRPSNELFDMIIGGKGIIMTDYGETYKNLRKFGLTTLRGFGVGKRSMEDNVIEETPYLIDELTSSDVEKNLKLKMNYAVSNIICRVVFGSRFNYDDEGFVELQEILLSFYKDTWEHRLVGLVSLAPFLRHLPVFKKAMKAMNGEINKFIAMLDKIKEEHKASFDENDIRDFIDAFIKEMKEGHEAEAGFTDGYLLHYIRDLFEAGTSTTSSTLVWAMLAFLYHPDCQEKIYAEIEAVIDVTWKDIACVIFSQYVNDLGKTAVNSAFGDSGVPSMKHRDQMPYTCAFIQELSRHRTPLPLGVFHKATEESTLRGYTIPKDTMVWGNIWSVHYDPDTFDNPEEFRPERFLDDGGQFVKSNRVIPFSIGPRHCLGEQLARMEVFIFLTGIVQKLRVLPDPGSALPDFNTGVFNMIYESRDFNVRFEKR